MDSARRGIFYLVLLGFSGPQLIWAQQPKRLTLCVAANAKHRVTRISIDRDCQGETARDSKTSSDTKVLSDSHALPRTTDNVKAHFGIVQSTVSVEADPTARDSSEGFERRISKSEIEKSAGTFGDPSRFIQMLPGVVSDNDQRNDFLVRGGNPSENLFIIDNIEIPSINQLSLSDTTGGFVSMIDNAAIQHMTLHTDAYDSKFDQRLSSVLEISTRPEGKLEPHSMVEFGLAGAGDSFSTPWGENGSLFASGRQSVLHLFTDDIGMNGVPIYQNGLVRAENRHGGKDSWWGLSLTGVDSIKIKPSAQDAFETNPLDVNYRGWRNTTGINWQHEFSAKSFGTVSLANSQQAQSIVQSDQLQSNAVIYNEKTSDGITTLKYDWATEFRPWALFSGGLRTSADRLNYVIQQPIGFQNPYSENPAPLDSIELNRKFTTTTAAGYSQISLNFPHQIKVVVGQRLMQWSLGGHTAWSPKVLIAAPIHGKLIHLGYAEYSQTAPYLYQLAFDNQRRLNPIKVKQITGGIDFLHSRYAKASLELYQKRYSDYPVSINYPQLSLANVADTFGQSFLMFPMISKGLGVGRGVELSIEANLPLHIQMTGALAYARVWYSGLDGILRRGNFDLPVIANFAATWSPGKRMLITVRYSGASGRPFTPDNTALSLSQNRDVYDLSRINAQRSGPYSRLDFRLEQSKRFYRGMMIWHVGLENALGTSNFYANQWRPRCPNCGVLQQDQMPRFPDGGFQYLF